ncbi:glycosyltransferase [Amycolatopsis sp. cmx-4-68]|uniref:glycosyltransferase n=1 Tax=Amycolatopsis sp. cmx-4-68 TaxID=2790938 RepID=UPI00397B9652
MSARPTVVVAVHDGWYGCGTGAGYANFGFLEALVGLFPAGVRLVVMPLRLSPASHEYHPRWHDRARRLAARVDARIVPVDNGTGGLDRWGSVAHFRRLAGNTADRLRSEVLPSAGPLLLVAFDVPFFGLPALLPPDVRARTVLVPRSSAIIHAPHDRLRVAWERAALHAGLADGTRIGAISRFMAGHLTREYGIPRSSLVAMPDGLAHSEWTGLRRAVTREIVPPGNFLLSLGRAQPYKGFDDLLDAIAILRDAGTRVPHLVLAATDEAPEPTRYQRSLLARLRSLDVEHTAVTRFTPAVPSLLSHPGLLGVVVPSRAEPFGRIPMEAFAAGAAPVIHDHSGRAGRAGRRRPDRLRLLTRLSSRAGRRLGTRPGRRPAGPGRDAPAGLPPRAADLRSGRRCPAVPRRNRALAPAARSR